MELPSYFTDFLTDINLPNNLQDELIEAHRELKKRVETDETFEGILETVFLQGSYKRSTIVKPSDDPEDKADVDVVVVTNLDREDYPDPNAALDEFEPFLQEHYGGQYRQQDRSFGIDLGRVTLDLVITATPSERTLEAINQDVIQDPRSTQRIIREEDLSFSVFNEDQLLSKTEDTGQEVEPLWIPDRSLRDWTRTDPLAQNSWTTRKNNKCNGNFLGVVKAIKWWRRNFGLEINPKSYPLERIIGEVCPDGIDYIAEGLFDTFRTIQEEFQSNIRNGKVPVLRDHGIPEHNVLERITFDEFNEFYDAVTQATQISRRALEAENIQDSASAWYELLGEPFPQPPSDGGSDDNGGDPGGGFTAREEETQPKTSEFA